MYWKQKIIASVCILIFLLYGNAEAADLRRIFEDNHTELDRLVRSMEDDRVDYVSGEKAIGKNRSVLSDVRLAYYRELLASLRLESFGNVKGPPYYGTVCSVNADEGGIQLGFAYGNVPEDLVVHSLDDVGQIGIPLYVSLGGRWYIYVLRYRNLMRSF
jgi:hypothetical protein